MFNLFSPELVGCIFNNGLLFIYLLFCFSGCIYPESLHVNKFTK